MIAIFARPWDTKLMLGCFYEWVWVVDHLDAIEENRSREFIPFPGVVPNEKGGERLPDHHFLIDTDK
jgi:hypothetical protein